MGGSGGTSLKARDVSSAGAGDSAHDVDNTFNPDYGGFQGGSINKGIIDTNILILFAIGFIGFALIKKVMK